MSSIALDLTAEEQALVKRLRSLKVPAMADALEQQLKDPNADLNSFMERISMLVDAECQSRANKRFARLLKKASLRYPTADIDKSIYLPERQLDTQTIERLSTCHWIEEGKNLLVTGASASGKTFLVNALCITAIKEYESAVPSLRKTGEYSLPTRDRSDLSTAAQHETVTS